MKRKIITLAMLAIFVFTSMAFAFNESPFSYDNNEYSFDNGSIYFIGASGISCCSISCSPSDIDN